MISESKASVLFAMDAQARQLADSGVDVAAAILGSSETTASMVYHSPATFGGIQVVGNANSTLVGRFSLIAPVENDTTGLVRNGMMDESAKWNINALPGMGLSDDELLTLLLYIPNMTETAADSILDWIDSDDTVRTSGAETQFYAHRQPSYAPKNGPIDSLDDLLVVQGVTPDLLYGEDANHNGILDPNEDDGDESMPYDNSDGILDPGWSGYLTVFASESNLQADGTAKINLNGSSIQDLYDQLSAMFDEDIAEFVVAFRIYGPVTPVTDGGASTTGDPDTDAALKAVAQGLSTALSGGGSNGQGATTKSGIQLTQAATTSFVSSYELIDAQVNAMVGAKTTMLESPFKSGSDLSTNWAAFAAAVTLSDTTTMDGRININQARLETLMGIPGMTEDIANAIASTRLVSGSGTADESLIEAHGTTVWLLADGLVDLPTLVTLDKAITGRGSVQRVQSVGFFESGGPVARVEAVIDGTKVPPQIISRRDLSPLGPGYTSEKLMSGATSSR
jgi:DNA uptake protein ComE-like DNA-binding protein